jgi:hypothetical protein
MAATSVIAVRRAKSVVILSAAFGFALQGEALAQGATALHIDEAACPSLINDVLEQRCQGTSEPMSSSPPRATKDRTAGKTTSGDADPTNDGSGGTGAVGSAAGNTTAAVLATRVAPEPGRPTTPEALRPATPRVRVARRVITVVATAAQMAALTGAMTAVGDAK